MKIRNGFVSNSSSSSFIVIGTNNISIPDGYVGDDFVVNGSLGNTEFGWQVEDWISFGDRVCFTFIQAMYLDNNKDDQPHLDMLVDILKKNLKCENVINELSLDYSSGEWAYIDHQSAASERENIEMFDSEESLFNFLFSNDSYIHTDNDNY